MSKAILGKTKSDVVDAFHSFFSVASPMTLASLVADINDPGISPPSHPESSAAFLRDHALEVLTINVGEAEARRLIDAAAASKESLSPVEMLDRALDRCGRGWAVSPSVDKTCVVVRAGSKSGDPLAVLVAIELEEAGFDAATFEAVNLCDGVVVVTPLVG